MCFHPLFEMSRAITSNLLLSTMRVSLACSSRWNWDQERSQYAPLKITCMIELVFNLLNITSFRHRQIELVLHSGNNCTRGRWPSPSAKKGMTLGEDQHSGKTIFPERNTRGRQAHEKEK
jgi:hypothetical protein